MSVLTDENELSGGQRDMVADLRGPIKQIIREAKANIDREFKQRKSTGLLDKFMNIFYGDLDEYMGERIRGYIEDMFDDIRKQLQNIENMIDRRFAGKTARELSGTFVSKLWGQAVSKINFGRIKRVLRGTINGILKKAQSEIEKLLDRKDRLETKEYPNVQRLRVYQLRASDFVGGVRNSIYEFVDEVEGQLDKVVEKAKQAQGTAGSGTRERVRACPGREPEERAILEQGRSP